MTFRFLDIELAVATATRTAAYHASFTTGLNVVQAPNTWGKSTLVQSLVYGLGLEGSFSASHLSPLGEAMTSVIDLDGQREAVVESSVTVTVLNEEGQALRVRRFPRSLEHEAELVHTWLAPSPERLEGAPRRDMFVRQGGGATHELGFHRLLEEFIGLSLPQVPGFNTDEVKLYLEVVLPLFYIEQKYGWSGLGPRVPTHFRIRAPYRRAAEFSLGLETLERIKERDAIKSRLETARLEWTESSDALIQVLASQGWEFSVTPEQSGPVEGAIPFGARRNGKWIPVEEEISRQTQAVAELEAAKVLTVGEGLDRSRAGLVEAEREVTRASSQYRALAEASALANTELQSLEARLHDLEHDRETLVDVRKLERLGSELGADSIERAHCPTCSQALDAASVATGIVMDVSMNLALIDAERTTLTRMVSDAREDVRRTSSRLEVANRELGRARSMVRSLKDELISPSSYPSIAQVEQRLKARDRLQAAEAALARAYGLLEEVNRSARAIASLQDRIRALRGDESDSDRAIVQKFARKFREVLGKFDLRSLPVSEVTIGDDSLLPEHDGFELSFDIRHGLSASDAIRTKWAHYIALASVSASEPAGSPLGILMMDEPRQQEAEFSSVRALYRELGNVATSTQVIVASSADTEEMASLLEGLSANLIANSKPHMFADGVART